MPKRLLKLMEHQSKRKELEELKLKQNKTNLRKQRKLETLKRTKTNFLAKSYSKRLEKSQSHSQQRKNCPTKKSQWETHLENFVVMNQNQSKQLKTLLQRSSKISKEASTNHQLHLLKILCHRLDHLPVSPRKSLV